VGASSGACTPTFSERRAVYKTPKRGRRLLARAREPTTEEIFPKYEPEDGPKPQIPDDVWKDMPKGPTSYDLPTVVGGIMKDVGEAWKTEDQKNIEKIVRHYEKELNQHIPDDERLRKKKNRGQKRHKARNQVERAIHDMKAQEAGASDAYLDALRQDPVTGEEQSSVSARSSCDIKAKRDLFDQTQKVGSFSWHTGKKRNTILLSPLESAMNWMFTGDSRMWRNKYTFGWRVRDDRVDLDMRNDSALSVDITSRRIDMECDYMVEHQYHAPLFGWRTHKEFRTTFVIDFNLLRNVFTMSVAGLDKTMSEVFVKANRVLGGMANCNTSSLLTTHQIPEVEGVSIAVCAFRAYYNRTIRKMDFHIARRTGDSAVMDTELAKYQSKNCQNQSMMSPYEPGDLPTEATGHLRQFRWVRTLTEHATHSLMSVTQKIPYMPLKNELAANHQTLPKKIGKSCQLLSEIGAVAILSHSVSQMTSASILGLSKPTTLMHVAASSVMSASDLNDVTSQMNECVESLAALSVSSKTSITQGLNTLGGFFRGLTSSKSVLAPFVRK